MPQTFECPILPAIEDVSYYSEMPSGCVLPYKLIPTATSQPVLRDRLQAIPDICFADYRFEVVFDWIKIAVRLPDARRALDIGKVLKTQLAEKRFGTAFVSGVSGCGKPSRDFIVQLNNPTYGAAEFVLDLLEKKYGLVSIPSSAGDKSHRLIGAEIAIDVYPRRSKICSDAEFVQKRVLMTELLKKHVVPKRLFSDGEFSEPLDSLRFVRSERLISSFSRKDAITIGGRRHSAQIVFDPERHPQGTVDAIMYIGAEKREMRYKVYDKIFDGMKDRTKKHEYLLPLEKSRSRLEVTLDGFSGDQSVLEALGVQSIYKISSFKWQGLRQILFNFVYPTFSMDGQGQVDVTELEVFKRYGAFGLDLYHRAERKKACDRKQRDSSGELLKLLEEKGRSTHFTELNDRITRKMKDLGKRFQN